MTKFIYQSRQQHKPYKINRHPSVYTLSGSGLSRDSGMNYRG